MASRIGRKTGASRAKKAHAPAVNAARWQALVRTDAERSGRSKRKQTKEEIPGLTRVQVLDGRFVLVPYVSHERDPDEDGIRPYYRRPGAEIAPDVTGFQLMQGPQYPMADNGIPEGGRFRTYFTLRELELMLELDPDGTFCTGLAKGFDRAMSLIVKAVGEAGEDVADLPDPATVEEEADEQDEEADS